LNKFSEFLSLSLWISFYRVSLCSYNINDIIIWVMNNRQAGGRSSETWSRPIEMGTNTNISNRVLQQDTWSHVCIGLLTSLASSDLLKNEYSK
jgi:hypothetical protein